MEYIKAIEDTLGKEAQKEFLPMQPGDVPRTEADVANLVENLGYKPNTPVSVGIEKFIRLRQNTLRLVAGMNGKVNRAEALAKADHPRVAP